MAASSRGEPTWVPRSRTPPDQHGLSAIDRGLPHPLSPPPTALGPQWVVATLLSLRAGRDRRRGRCGRYRLASRASAWEGRWGRLLRFDSGSAVALAGLALGRPLTLAGRLAAGRSPQPICSASSTMIPLGRGRSGADSCLRSAPSRQASSAPRARKLATMASMSSTANATWRMPGVFAGACWSPPRPDGV